MEDINLTEAREFILSLLPEVGDVLRSYFKSTRLQSTDKGGVDFKTQADDDVDQLLIKRITQKYPQAELLTEETAPKDYSSYKDKNNVWVIDSLDGTTNFSRGNKNFAVAIGLVDKGIPKLGIVFMPMEEEIYWAQEGIEKAMCNDAQISVSNTSDLGKAVVATDWPWDMSKRPTTIEFQTKISPHVRAMKQMGSAAADLCSLAAGRIDGYVHPGVKPWDVAAAGLIVQKAGGTISLPDGGKWDIFHPDILATNGILHDQLLNLLHGT